MMYGKESDRSLVSLYRNGDEKAFETLLLRHRARVYSAIYLIVKDRYVAEDLLQEVFIKAVDAIRHGRYNEEGKFLSWVSRMAHNLAIDHFRKKKRSPEIVFEEGTSVFNEIRTEGVFAESIQLGENNGKALRDFVKELPTEQRHVLIMRHYLHMNFQEIADRTGVSINTALGRMRYAIINLRKKMKKKPITHDPTFYA